MNPHVPVVFAAALSLSGTAIATEEAQLKNWFNDPFFQARNGMPACPVPLGPLLTEAQMKAESHSRIERGTSCWIAGQCKQPNAYLYDATIAEEARQRFAATTSFADTSIWITVKRRFVWVEGCVADPNEAVSLKSLVQSIPDVEQVLVNVMTGVTAKPPYSVLPK
jgi:hypothetical protein